MKIKLAEALLRRKELQDKVNILKSFKDNHIYYEVRGQRVKVTEGLEDINVNYPKLEATQVTAEYDFYARALRLIDSYIQQANWIHELDVASESMSDYKVSK